MNERDCYTVDAMEKSGGSFIRGLANLARRADPVNLQLIKETWPANWAHYEAEGIKLEEQSKQSGEHATN